MKTRILTVLAGLSCPLILSASTPAAFTGINVTSKPNEFGILAFNVYAVFDDPDNDFLYAVAGIPGSPLNITVKNGTFYQNPLGTDLSPNPILIDIFPSLAYDSFVTIGKKTSVGDATLLGAGWPGFGASTLTIEDNAWFITPKDPQGEPDANNQVLLGQFSTEDGTGLEGELLLQGLSGDEVFQVYVNFDYDANPCPEDINGDGTIDVLDLLILLASWGACPEPCPPTCPSDLDGDCSVGVIDLLVWLAYHGGFKCP